MKPLGIVSVCCAIHLFSLGVVLAQTSPEPTPTLTPEQIADKVFLAKIAASELEEQAADMKKKETANSEKYTFRKTRWGMSKEEVIKAEGAPDEVIDGPSPKLVYVRDTAGFDSLVVFNFVKNQLTSSMVGITGKHASHQSFYRDFSKLRGLLISKYGIPADDGLDGTWFNDLYQDDEQEWGFAASLGHVVFICTWDLEKTKIQLVLTGDNHKCTLGIHYMSTELHGLEEQATSEASIEGL